MISDIKQSEQDEEKQDPNDFIDEQAEELDPSKCLTFVDADNVKDLEQMFFSNVAVEAYNSLGGSHGSKSGGVTAFAISPN